MSISRAPLSIDARRSNRARQLVAAVSLAMIAAVLAAQPLPGDLGDWKIEYGASGGLAFFVHAVTLTRGGDLEAVDTRMGDRVATRAQATLLEKVTALLKTARQAKPSGRPPMPDAIYRMFTLTTGGRPYEIESPELVAVLDETWDAVIRGALVGTWRQSGWKLCTPASQLSAGDLDPPIDDLSFRDDGTFSITWRGGGAHTGGIPHVFLPDYNGRYSTQPTSGAIRLTIGDGIFHPTDFAGDGTFSIRDGQLTLERVWFGTKQARRKPDICQMTFVRP